MTSIEFIFFRIGKNQMNIISLNPDGYPDHGD